MAISTNELCKDLRGLLVEFQAACQANQDGALIKDLRTKINCIVYMLDQRDGGI